MQFKTDEDTIAVYIEQLIVAGWTGRDRAAVDHHIAELAALGIAPPSQVPLYYRVSANLLTQDNYVQVVGDTSSGEVEPLLIRSNDQLWLGLGSDHTDRQLETYTVAASKQACVKPVAAELWAYDSVAAHIDELILRCSIEENGQWVSYQEGTLASIQPLQTLINAAPLSEDAAMLCGTLGAIGGVRPARHYHMSLEDPVLSRSIHLEYRVDELPVVM